MDCSFVHTYSCGDSSGFEPDSLLNFEIISKYLFPTYEISFNHSAEGRELSTLYYFLYGIKRKGTAMQLCKFSCILNVKLRLGQLSMGLAVKREVW